LGSRKRNSSSRSQSVPTGPLGIAALSGIGQDFSSLQSAQAQRPGYSYGAPTQAAVNQAAAAAQSAVTAALATANAAITQVNAYQVDAYNDAVAAAKAGSCAGPATQFVQPSLT
jgi:hypothetical protein